MQISLTELSRKAKYFNNIKKAEVGIDVYMDYGYFGNDRKVSLTPRYKDVTDLPKVAKICEITNSPITDEQVDSTCAFLTKLFPRDTTKYSFQEVCKAHQSAVNSGVKYAPYDVFGDLTEITPYYISRPPAQQQIGDRTYRILAGNANLLNACFSYRTMETVFIANDQHPVYNYLDQGHTIVFYNGPDNEESKILVLNQLGLDSSYLVALFAIDPDKVLEVATNNIFINARDARILALKVEKSLNEANQTKFKDIKAKILADFEKNAQNLVVTKFQRQEVTEVNLNSIKFAPNKIQYEGITLEAEGISSVVLNKLDTNSEFDIYTVLNVYVTHLMEEISSTPLNPNHIGFSIDRTFNFKVNGIDINLAISKAHTRRRINGYLINTAEVERVIRRAACFTEADKYNSFIRQVAKMSLECHDVLSNGLPVKVHIFSQNDYWREATNAHPKLRFTKEKDGHIKIYINREKTASVPIKRFVGFIRDIQKLNKDTNGNQRGYGPAITDAHGYTRQTYLYKDAEWCQQELVRIINEHIAEAKGTAMTAEQQKAFIEGLLAERIAAEKKSAELLKSVVKETEAEAGNHGGVEGYFVKGSLRRYFVEKKAPHKVYNADENFRYICIVDGRGEMGVGYDALVARLLAVKNDSFTVRNITTLRAG